MTCGEGGDGGGNRGGGKGGGGNGGDGDGGGNGGGGDGEGGGGGEGAEGGGGEGRGGEGGALGGARVTATFFATVTVGADSTVTPSIVESEVVFALARASAFVCTEAPMLASSSR